MEWIQRQDPLALSDIFKMLNPNCKKLYHSIGKMVYSKYTIICKFKWCFAKDTKKSSHREVWLFCRKQLDG